MAGWERVLIPRIGNLIDASVRNFPASLEVPKAEKLIWGREGARQSSPNHEAMAWNGELLRAAAYGSAAEYDAAREVVLFYLAQELKGIGLWTGEPCTGVPHGGMHLDAMFAGRLAARIKRDGELLATQDEHLRRLFAYLAASSTPGGEVLCCGARMPKGPAATQQSAIFRELHGLPHPNRESMERQMGSDFWVSFRAFRALKARRDRFGGAKEITAENATLPLLKFPLEIRRWPGGHLARFLLDPGTRVAGVTCWVLVDHQQADQGRSRGIQFGVASLEAPLDRVPPEARQLLSPRGA